MMQGEIMASLEGEGMAAGNSFSILDFDSTKAKWSEENHVAHS